MFVSFYELGFVFFFALFKEVTCLQLVFTAVAHDSVIACCWQIEH